MSQDWWLSLVWRSSWLLFFVESTAIWMGAVNIFLRQCMLYFCMDILRKKYTGYIFKYCTRMTDDLASALCLRVWYAWREVCVNVNMTERLYVMNLCKCTCLCHYGSAMALLVENIKNIEISWLLNQILTQDTDLRVLNFVKEISSINNDFSLI